MKFTPAQEQLHERRQAYIHAEAVVSAGLEEMMLAALERDPNPINGKIVGMPSAENFHNNICLIRDLVHLVPSGLKRAISRRRFMSSVRKVYPEVEVSRENAFVVAEKVLDPLDGNIED